MFGASLTAVVCHQLRATGCWLSRGTWCRVRRHSTPLPHQRGIHVFSLVKSDVYDCLLREDGKLSDRSVVFARLRQRYKYGRVTLGRIVQFRVMWRRCERGFMWPCRRPDRYLGCTACTQYIDRCGSRYIRRTKRVIYGVAQKHWHNLFVCLNCMKY